MACHPRCKKEGGAGLKKLSCADFPGTVCAVTHDRYFLDNVAGWILELDRGQGIPFEGNYNQWLEAKGKRLEVGGSHSAHCQFAIIGSLFAPPLPLSPHTFELASGKLSFYQIQPRKGGSACSRIRHPSLGSLVWSLKLLGVNNKFVGTIKLCTDAQCLRQVEANKQSGLKKAIEEELEWVRGNAKGQQKKGKARLRSYEALTQQVPFRCLVQETPARNRRGTDWQLC